MPAIADRSQSLVLDGAVEDYQLLTTGAGHRRGIRVRFEAASVGEATRIVADLGQSAC